MPDTQTIIFFTILVISIIAFILEWFPIEVTSLSFMTPNGYQTNTMVFTPGGYRYMDFMKAGIPLHIILGIIGVVLIPIIWPL